MLDVLDHMLIQAIQRSPRASYATISAVLEVSEQTVARRFQRLRSDGIVRVLGSVRPGAKGHSLWITRIRSRPEKARMLAEALARSSDVAHVTISSGVSEVVCAIHSPINTSQELVLQQLPANSVLEITVDLLLHRFGDGSGDWVASAHPLSPAQRESLAASGTPHRRAAAATVPTRLSDEDLELLALLADDGRASFSRLAAAVGSSEGRVAHRIDTLESNGTLYFEVDLAPQHLGFTLQAHLWIRAAPGAVMAIGEGLGRHREVLFAGATSGSFNIFAAVLCRDASHLHHYLTTEVAALTGITGYEVSIVSRKLKQSGTTIVDGRLVPSSSMRR